MKVFIIKKCEVGNINEIKDVSNGYASNFLIPNGYVVPWVSLNKKEIENRLKKNEEKILKDNTKKTNLSILIEKEILTFNVKSHNDGVIYGSIGASEISDELKKRSIVVAKNQILLEKPFKKTGIYLVKIKLSNALQPELRVKIVSNK